MTTYNNTFGSDTVPPSQYGYQALSISSNTTLVWPYNSTGGTTTSKIIDLTATAGLSLTMPDATLVSTGEDCLIRNVGSETVTIKDNSGGVILTIAASAAKYLYLTDNSTAAGTWGTVAYGVGTSSVDAATLVGYGLMASGVTLNSAHPVEPSASGVTIDATYRAKVFVFTGGADTLALTAAATLGDNFYSMVRNSGTGTLTINPDGGELIDGVSALDLQPGESLILACSGTAWYSVGYGRSILYQFSQLVKDVSAGGTITLTASEASNKLLTFNGNPASDLNVVVPNTVAVYYVQSSISTAKTVTVKTAAGTGSAISQSQRIIMICDGTNVVSAQSAAASANLTYLDGSAASPSANFSSSTNTGFFLKGTNGVGISANGVEIGSFETTGLTLVSPLAVAQGGTGRATSTTAYGLLAAGTTATGAQQTLAAGLTTQILVGGGAAALPVWTAATGSGAPVRATSPTLVTPVLGVATATSVNAVTVNNIPAGINSRTGVLIGDATTAPSATNDAVGSVIIGGSSGASLTSGSNNTLLGYFAGLALTAGTSNVVVGSSAFVSSTGNSNTVVGYAADNGSGEDPPYIGTGSNNIVLGANARPSASNVSNEVTIGDDSITSFRVPGFSLTATGKTGTGSFVLATSPTLVTPNIGVATATSVNGSTIPSSVTLGTTLGTEQASTSGTAIDFTGIPSWAKTITIMFDGVSVNGTGFMQVQIGDSGGIETSGYNSVANDYQSSVLGGGAFLVTLAQSASLTTWGSVVLSLKNASTNSWSEFGVLGTNSGATSSAGMKSLTGTLDRLRISTTANDTFDAGSINISYSP